MEEKVKMVLADILELDLDSIDSDTSMNNSESWDSLNHLNLVLALEQEFQMTFEVKDIESMLSYPDILKTLQGKL